jgi:hypothetical protein
MMSEAMPAPGFEALAGRRSPACRVPNKTPQLCRRRSTTAVALQRRGATTTATVLVGLIPAPHRTCIPRRDHPSRARAAHLRPTMQRPTYAHAVYPLEGYKFGHKPSKQEKEGGAQERLARLRAKCVGVLLLEKHQTGGGISEGRTADAAVRRGWCAASPRACRCCAQRTALLSAAAAMPTAVLPQPGRFEREGLRRSVEAVLLVQQHGHPHVLMLQVRGAAPKRRWRGVGAVRWRLSSASAAPPRAAEAARRGAHHSPHSTQTICAPAPPGLPAARQQRLLQAARRQAQARRGRCARARGPRPGGGGGPPSRRPRARASRWEVCAARQPVYCPRQRMTRQLGLRGRWRREPSQNPVPQASLLCTRQSQHRD